MLILGHRCGCVPERDNPEQLSITHLEFRRAAKVCDAIHSAFDLICTGIDSIVAGTCGAIGHAG